MKFNPWSLRLLCGLAGLVAGCQSVPTRFYALHSEPGNATSANYAGPAVRVTVVRVPAIADRIELTRQVGEGEFKISETERWSAPPGSMIQQVLSADLASRLPPGKLIFPHLPKPAGVLSLNVDVLEWVIAAKEVRLLVGWTITPPDSAPIDSIMLRRPLTTADARQITEALSDIVAQLSDQIVADLSR